MPFAHTFSIVAKDPVTGEYGVAVQSHWFAVGTIVPWARAGVGAVATQSFCEPAYGRDGLAGMGDGAAVVLRRLLDADTSPAVRQVAMIDATGATAVWTGSKCIEHHGHYTPGGKPAVSEKGRFSVGREFSVQANLMDNATIVPAMAEAYLAASGDLPDRLLATLDAAQAAGGDARGMQSAAMVVVAGVDTGKPWVDRKFDLRVDDAIDPLRELRRLVHVQRAYHHMNEGDSALERKDPAAATAAFSAAAEAMPGRRKSSSGTR